MDEQTITTGFTLAWPWLLALAPVPFLLRWLMPEASGSSQQAVRVPWFEAVTSGRAGGMRRPLLLALGTLVWLLLVAAAQLVIQDVWQV